MLAIGFMTQFETGVGQLGENGQYRMGRSVSDLFSCLKLGRL
jgi:hypothetical protein